MGNIVCSTDIAEIQLEILECLSKQGMVRYAAKERTKKTGCRKTYRFDCENVHIAVISSQPRMGATTTALGLCTWLGAVGATVCYVEENESNILTTILTTMADAGYIQKEARFRERNRGQSSNLYILLFVEQMPTPDNDNTLVYEDYIEPVTPESGTGKHKTEVAHITFDTLKSEKQEKQTAKTARNEFVPAARSATKKNSPPIHLDTFGTLSLHYLSERMRAAAGQFQPRFSSAFL